MVAEMLGMSCGRRASRRRRIVVLPTPEGPEMTTMLPMPGESGRTIDLLYIRSGETGKDASSKPVSRPDGARAGRRRRGSLEVLNELPQPLDAGLDLHDGVGDGHVG